ncbi:MAG: PepSY-like domain-containing protein [Planctomycetes bacterium]|nr:PepSY-like domain-containing protein [Planctomycetota bacterium]
MKQQNWGLVGFIVLAAAILCTTIYADKHEEVTLPEAVKAAIAKLYPTAEIEEVETKKESIEVYKVELKQNEREAELTVAPDGTLAEAEKEVTIGDLSQEVANAIINAVPGAKVDEISQETIYAVVKLIPLDVPKTIYEATLIKDGMKTEIEISADGTVLKQEIEEDNDDDDDKDEDDDDDNNDEEDD